MALVTLRENAESIVGNLSDETKLPRNLLQRFSEMWCNRDPPFFAKVSEDGTLAAGELCELVRSLKVSSALLCSSVTRVISGGAEAVDFETFVRGYARLHARTLKEALPFAFAVFDLDGDGILSQEEFTRVIEANLAMQELDPAAIKRVLNSPKGKDAAGVSYDAFRYFASLTSETILATCGFCLHVRDFYVPLTPLGTEEEEAAEDAAKAEALRVDRERAHAPGGIAASASGEGEGGAAAGEAAAEGDAAYFSDPDFMAAIESLRTTPEERASRCKDKGNEGMKHGKEGIEHAVQSYGEGLDEKCNDAVLNATLYSNRAAAHTMLKNWGKALADASSAVEMDVLPAPSALKACRRGAAAALKLSKLRQAEALCARGEAIEGGAATELKELAAIRKGVAKAREAEEARRRKAAEEAQRETALKAAIAKRGLYIGDFIDPALREQCVGAASGARIWYDDEIDELHLPVLFLYPEPAQSDFIQDVAEAEAMLPHLVEMFGERGENAPEWDRERRYKSADLRIYLSYKHPEDDRDVMLRLRTDLALVDQLVRAQAKGYAVPGIPILHVVVGGSEYERKYVLPAAL